MYIRKYNLSFIFVNIYFDKYQLNKLLLVYKKKYEFNINKIIKETS